MFLSRSELDPFFIFSITHFGPKKGPVDVAKTSVTIKFEFNINNSKRTKIHDLVSLLSITGHEFFSFSCPNRFVSLIYTCLRC